MLYLSMSYSTRSATKVNSREPCGRNTKAVARNFDCNTHIFVLFPGALCSHAKFGSAALLIPSHGMMVQALDIQGSLRKYAGKLISEHRIALKHLLGHNHECIAGMNSICYLLLILDI